MSGPRWAIPVLVALTFLACSDNKKVPGGILPQDKMVALLWDMTQADQYANLYLVKDSAKINLKTETLRLYEAVFRLHHTTREEFSKSYRYYLDHPELNQVLYDSVLALGARARTEMYDRPFYHPPVPPAIRPGAVTPVKPGVGTPLRAGGTVPGRPVIIPGRPFDGVVPGRTFNAVVPGRPAGLTPEEMRRAHEAAVRRSQDSMARALIRGKTDTTRRH